MKRLHGKGNIILSLVVPWCSSNSWLWFYRFWIFRRQKKLKEKRRSNIEIAWHKSIRRRRHQFFKYPHDNMRQIKYKNSSHFTRSQMMRLKTQHQHTAKIETNNNAEIRSSERKSTRLNRDKRKEQHTVTGHNGNKSIDICADSMLCWQSEGRVSAAAVAAVAAVVSVSWK